MKKDITKKILRVGRNRYRLFRRGLGRYWKPYAFYYRMRYPETEVAEALKSAEIFFIHGTGRSGTQMLSRFLGGEENTAAYHEPDYGADVQVMQDCYRSEEFSINYIRNYRRYRILNRIRNNPGKRYGEITGTLRYQVGAIKEIIPGAKMLLVVRDGRDVVRSVMRWPFYVEGAKGALNITPNQGDPYYDRWDGMNRFQKVCWSWMDSNRILLEHIPKGKVVLFEDMLKDYDCFLERVAKPLELTISEEQWKSAVSRKSDNAARVHTFPHWKDWDGEQRRSFDDICGSMMEKLGYYVPGDESPGR